jgi:transposase
MGYTQTLWKPKESLAVSPFWDSIWLHDSLGFLSPVDRADLIGLARDGSAAHRLARRANAIVLLDAGYNFRKVAEVLLLDDGTIRAWHKMFVDDGLEGLTRFESGGSACQMSDEQRDKLKAWVASALPRSTRQIGAWVEKEFGLVYAGRSGLMALLNRLGLEYHKPEVIPRKLDEDKQRLHRGLRKTVEFPVRKRSRVVRRRGASNPCRAARRLLGATRSSRLSRRAGASASTFTAPSIWKPARPG